MSAAKTHISLNVANVARSTEFYSAFLGAAPNKEKPGYANFSLDNPALKLALNESPNAVRGEGLNHLGIQVVSLDEVVAARDRLKAAGLATFDENDVTCCYARQEKVWVTDPDGNAWEVYVLLEDSEQASGGCCEEQSAPCCEAACC